MQPKMHDADKLTLEQQRYMEAAQKRLEQDKTGTSNVEMQQPKQQIKNPTAFVPKLNYDESTIQAVVMLPSLGLLYNGRIPDGKIMVRATRTKDEKLMLGSNGTFEQKMDSLIATCTNLPKGFQPSELLATDRIFLFFKIRMLSLGESYSFSLKCPACAKSWIHTMKLSELKVKYYDVKEQVFEPFSLVLPRCKNVLGYRMLRGYDEVAIADVETKSSLKSTALGDPTHTYAYGRRIVSLDSQDLTEDQAMSVAEQLISEDANALIQDVEKRGSGIDTTLVIGCNACRHVFEAEMPITAEFLRPKIRD